jgi:tRNA modification GTPase
MNSGTTIAAIASPPGAGERGVLRLSGARTEEFVRATCSTSGEPLRELPRGVHSVRFDDGRGTLPALLFWMPGPRSFTREDVAELHLPGAPALLSVALERLLALGAAPAGPGEFTRRAFVNGRIDLTRAEGVLALVSARDAGERRAATALLFGGLGDRMTALRDTLDGLRSLCEASLDFDETDTGHVPEEDLARGARGVATGLAEALSWEERRTPFAGVAEIVLAGEPNAGKSRLFNRLTAGKALVSDHAGTTRDALSGEWRLAGLACRLLDTAGVDAAASGPDGDAQELGSRAREAADLVLWVVDATQGEPSPAAAQGGRLTVWNKIDLLSDEARQALPNPFSPSPSRPRQAPGSRPWRRVRVRSSAVRRAAPQPPRPWPWAYAASWTRVTGARSKRRGTSSKRASLRWPPGSPWTSSRRRCAAPRRSSTASLDARPPRIYWTASSPASASASDGGAGRPIVGRGGLRRLTHNM